MTIVPTKRAHRPRARRLAVVLAAAIASASLAVPAAAAQREPVVDRFPGPARQSVGHRSQTLGHDVGRLRIPAIEVDEPVRAGVDLSVIDRGVAHWSGTSAPGGAGNVVLAGHRTTHSAPFYDLDDLADGDLIYLTGGEGIEVMYRVSDTFIVSPDDIWITYDASAPMVTLFACHPKGSAARRIVVQGELVAGGRIL